MKQRWCFCSEAWNTPQRSSSEPKTSWEDCTFLAAFPLNVWTLAVLLCCRSSRFSETSASLAPLSLPSCHRRDLCDICACHPSAAPSYANDLTPCHRWGVLSQGWLTQTGKAPVVAPGVGFSTLLIDRHFPESFKRSDGGDMEAYLHVLFFSSLICRETGNTNMTDTFLTWLVMVTCNTFANKQPQRAANWFVRFPKGISLQLQTALRWRLERMTFEIVSPLLFQTEWDVL